MSFLYKDKVISILEITFWYKNDICHQQFQVAIIPALKNLIYQMLDSPLERGGGLFEQIQRIPELCVMAFFVWTLRILKNICTGSLIVSPAAIVRKLKIPALSRNDLSFVKCLELRKFVGSNCKQSLPSQKWFILLVGWDCPGVQPGWDQSESGHGYRASLPAACVPKCGEVVVSISSVSGLLVLYFPVIFLISFILFLKISFFLLMSLLLSLLCCVRFSLCMSFSAFRISSERRLVQFMCCRTSFWRVGWRCGNPSSRIACRMALLILSCGCSGSA